jgi:NAD(P)H dehydrogenase (quinone)
MRVFIVHAHHEPKSFNGALTSAASKALIRFGHEVQVSDLYAARFDPVSDRRNFRTVKDPDRFDQQVEEAYASEKSGYVEELQREMDKVDWCDALIFQFPLWWLGLPAILKGWVDRVFAVGRAYGGGRYFSRGVFAGKRAMCSTTSGGRAAPYSEFGVYGPIDAILYPIHRGIFEFAGFSVVAPFVVHAPSRMSEPERALALKQYQARVLSIDRAPTLTMLDMSHYEGLVRGNS